MPLHQSHLSDDIPVPISITICGDGGCGKSSITLRLVRSQWVSDYDPTIEDSYSITRRIDGITYHLSLTDTAGQEEYRGMWASSNLGADAFLLVYDITSLDSLNALDYFNELIDMEVEVRLDNASRARRAGLPLTPSLSAPYLQLASSVYAASSRTVSPIKMVAGNKCDLAGSREVSATVGLEWARRRGCGFMETSARLEVNIEETFCMIVRRVVERRQLAAAGFVDDSPRDRRGVTKPLAPLTDPMSLPAALGAIAQMDDEKASNHARSPRLRGPNLHGGERIGRREDRFWRKLRCW